MTPERSALWQRIQELDLVSRWACGIDLLPLGWLSEHNGRIPSCYNGFFSVYQLIQLGDLSYSGNLSEKTGLQSSL